MLMIVDDSIVIRQFLSTSLGSQGFQVETADSGLDAFKQLGSDASRFQAIITDIQLDNGPNGWDVARRARELAPAIPVVYMTATCEHEWIARGVVRSVIVRKPFTLPQMRVALSTLISGLSITQDLTANSSGPARPTHGTDQASWNAPTRLCSGGRVVGDVVHQRRSGMA
jgi:CheY-like chemotaxis protein